MTTLTQSIIIKAPISEVWNHATNMDHWTEWYVGLDVLEDVSGPNEAGTTYTISAKMAAGLINLKLKGRIEEKVPNELWRGSTSGAMDSTSTWRYHAHDDGTRVEVEVDYTLGESLLARIADRLVMEKKSSADLATTLQQLKARVEGAAS